MYWDIKYYTKIIPWYPAKIMGSERIIKNILTVFFLSTELLNSSFILIINH
jgi:hypothetical protein